MKGSEIFINEDLILQDQVELRKEVQKVKETRKEGKWALIRNRKFVARFIYLLLIEFSVQKLIA